MDQEFGGVNRSQVAGYALLLVMWCAQGFSASAQLTNPGFETSTALPSAPGMWHLLPGWNNALSGLSSPDFFHIDGTFGGDLPETPVAMVSPYEALSVCYVFVIGSIFTPPHAFRYLAQAA